MKTNLSINVTILLLFLIGSEPALTGNWLHEWLNLAFTGAVLLHLLMHWDWVAVVLRRRMSGVSRTLCLNFILDLLLFVVFVMMILIGLMISRNILAPFGDVPARHSVWRGLHSGFGNVLLSLVGLHFALHWKWIVHACSRCLITPMRGQIPR